MLIVLQVLIQLLLNSSVLAKAHVEILKRNSDSSSSSDASRSDAQLGSSNAPWYNWLPQPNNYDNEALTRGQRQQARNDEYRANDFEIEFDPALVNRHAQQRRRYNELNDDETRNTIQIDDLSSHSFTDGTTGNYLGNFRQSSEESSQSSSITSAGRSDRSRGSSVRSFSTFGISSSARSDSSGISSTGSFPSFSSSSNGRSRGSSERTFSTTSSSSNGRSDSSRGSSEGRSRSSSSTSVGRSDSSSGSSERSLSSSGSSSNGRSPEYYTDSESESSEFLSDDERSDPVLVAIANLKRQLAVQRRLLNVGGLDDSELRSIAIQLDRINGIVRIEVGHRFEQWRRLQVQEVFDDLNEFIKAVNRSGFRPDRNQPSTSA